jgi:hypothetical protein
LPIRMPARLTFSRESNPFCPFALATYCTPHPSSPPSSRGLRARRRDGVQQMCVLACARCAQPALFRTKCCSRAGVQQLTVFRCTRALRLRPRVARAGEKKLAKVACPDPVRRGRSLHTPLCALPSVSAHDLGRLRSLRRTHSLARAAHPVCAVTHAPRSGRMARATRWAARTAGARLARTRR